MVAAAADGVFGCGLSIPRSAGGTRSVAVIVGIQMLSMNGAAYGVDARPRSGPLAADLGPPMNLPPTADTPTL